MRTRDIPSMLSAVGEGLRGGALLQEKRWHCWHWLVSPSLSPAFMRSLRRLDKREDHNVIYVLST